MQTYSDNAPGIPDAPFPHGTRKAGAIVDKETNMDPPKALRKNDGKPQMDFILDFPIAVEALCRVKELGAVKYARDNWKLGGKPDSEYYAACMRHLMAAKTAKDRGEMFADDSGCLHLAHAMWNIMALIELNVRETHDPELFGAMVEKWSDDSR